MTWNKLAVTILATCVPSLAASEAITLNCKSDPGELGEVNAEMNVDIENRTIKFSNSVDSIDATTDHSRTSLAA